MPHGLQVKDGVRFDRIARSGGRLLASLDRAARLLERDLTITCACESHPPGDPHTLGEAYDVRTHDVPAELKPTLLRIVLEGLADPDEIPQPAGGGLGTRHFWGWIEHAGADAEHLHVQRRQGTFY